MTVTVVDGPAMEWVNGSQVYDSMEPAFRDNFGGDEEQVRELLSKYWMRSLWLDPGTTRRIDHVRTDPGYVDLSEAYHDSVEEAYFLGGDCTLSAEGDFVAGDYFWRPPGWVHKAWSTGGFENILCMEGEVASDGSGRVSRVVRPDDEAGQQARDTADHPTADGVGPRGYVRRAETRFMPWSVRGVAATGISDGLSLHAKVLSENDRTGACSVLVRVPSGWSDTPVTLSHERFIVNVTGDLAVDGTALGPCSLVHVPAGAAPPVLGAPSGAELLVKVGERR